jgi:hypothetical protein
MPKREKVKSVATQAMKMQNEREDIYKNRSFMKEPMEKKRLDVIDSVIMKKRIQ